MESKPVDDELSQFNKQPLAGFIRICTKQELMENKGVKVNVSGRDIALFCHEGKVYALDKHCYHAGGPLENGDIEEIAGHVCIVCPYHKHRITLDTGESMVFKQDWRKKDQPGEWCSKGRMQRTHQVRVIQDVVYVALSDLSSPQESDYFYD